MISKKYDAFVQLIAMEHLPVEIAKIVSEYSSRDIREIIKNLYNDMYELSKSNSSVWIKLQTGYFMHLYKDKFMIPGRPNMSADELADFIISR